MWWRYAITGVIWLSIILFLPVLLILTLPLYLLWIRPWQLRWGASGEEVKRAMPGDDIVRNPHFIATRGVTVNAPPEKIWPWLVQMGCLRAGWYSYDWVDNLGFHSSERIIPEFQQIQEGDSIPFSPDGKMAMWVESYKTNHWILWTGAKGESTWFWGLYPTGENSTRMLTRLRVHYDLKLPWLIYYVLFDAGDIVMMRKAMLGIKRRAEGTPCSRCMVKSMQ